MIEDGYPIFNDPVYEDSALFSLLNTFGDEEKGNEKEESISRYKGYQGRL